MKNYSSPVFLIFALITVFASCRKNTDKNTVSLTGTWELREKSGMFLTTYPPGNGTLLKFSASTYEMYTNNQLTQSGTYMLLPDNTVKTSVCLEFPEGQFTNRIVYDQQQNTPKKFIDIVNNRLTLISGCYAFDAGHSEVYEK
jgi:hypothetical protein